MEASDPRYDYNRFGSAGKRVGQAVVDILSKEQPSYTVGDVLDGYATKFAQELEKCIEDNKDKYRGAFYVLVMTHKEMWADNVVRNWFIARQTPPYAMDMMQSYPHRTKTLYMVDPKKGHITIIWSIPGFEECKSILKNKETYDPQLVKWIVDCFNGDLDKDSYEFV